MTDETQLMEIKSESPACYVADSREQLMQDLLNSVLRWVPVAMVKDRLDVGNRDDRQRCLIMGDRLIDDDTDSGMDTWLIIHGLLEDGLLEEVETEADPFSICEYRST